MRTNWVRLLLYCLLNPFHEVGDASKQAGEVARVFGVGGGGYTHDGPSIIAFAQQTATAVALKTRGT